MKLLTLVILFQFTFPHCWLTDDLKMLTDVLGCLGGGAVGSKEG